MKRLILIIFLACVCCVRADDTWNRTGDLWDRVGGIWSRASVTPVTSDLIMSYLMLANDTSILVVDATTNSYDGTPNNSVLVEGTNGLKTHWTMAGGASDYITAGLPTTYYDEATQMVAHGWFRIDTFSNYDALFKTRNSTDSFGVACWTALGQLNFIATEVGLGSPALQSRTINDVWSLGEWFSITWVAKRNVAPSTQMTNTLYANGEIIWEGLSDQGGAIFGQNDVVYIGWDDGAADRKLQGAVASFGFSDTPTNYTPAVVAEMNITEGAELGTLSSFAEANRDVLAVCSNVVTCNGGFQDWKIHGVADSPDVPTSDGNLSIGWGVGNGIAEHLIVTASNASNIMFSAGVDTSSMTNFAIIDGVQYADGSAQAFSNVYYEHAAASNVFWRVGGSTYYAGNIAQIHQGGSDLTEAMYFSFDAYVKANINWTE